MDEILEDIFVYFKDRMSPIKVKAPAPEYEMDPSKISIAPKKMACLSIKRERQIY